MLELLKKNKRKICAILALILSIGLCTICVDGDSSQEKKVEAVVCEEVLAAPEVVSYALEEKTIEEPLELYKVVNDLEEPEDEVIEVPVIEEVEEIIDEPEEFEELEEEIVEELEPEDTETKIEIETETEPATYYAGGAPIDIDFLAKLMWAEGGTMSWDGQVYLCSAILNLCDITGKSVWTAGHTYSMFSVAYIVDGVVPSQTQYDVINYVLNGGRIPNIAYFRTDYYHSFGTPFCVIDNVYFSTP